MCPGFKVHRPKETPSNTRWRVGIKLGRTLYVGDDLVGVMDTPALALLVVEAVNKYDRVRESVLARAPLYFEHPTCPDCGGKVHAGGGSCPPEWMRAATPIGKLREKMKIYGRAFRVRRVHEDWPAIEHVIKWMENGGASDPPDVPAVEAKAAPGSRAADLHKARVQSVNEPDVPCHWCGQNGCTVEVIVSLGRPRLYFSEECFRRFIAASIEYAQERKILPPAPPLHDPEGIVKPQYTKSVSRRLHALERFVRTLHDRMYERPGPAGNQTREQVLVNAIAAALDAFDHEPEKKAKEDPDA